MVLDTSVEINPFNKNAIIKTNNVLIGANGIYSQVVNSQDIYSNKFHTYYDGQEYYGMTGNIEFAVSGKTYRFINGLLVYATP